MNEFLLTIPFSFAALFPVLNPLGFSVIFLALTQGAPAPIVNKLARQVAVNTFILLVAVLLIGAWILRFFGISIPIVQVGGGLVMAHIGWNLLNQATTPSENSDTAADEISNKNIKDMAFFPLTMPITAGPGSMTVTLTLGAHELHPTLTATAFAQAGVVVGIALSAITVFICYRYARRLTNFFGTAGTQVVTRLSAFLTLCIGVSVTWKGVEGLIRPYI